MERTAEELLAVVCAGTIITLSVLLAVALNDNKPPVDSSSSNPVSNSSGGVLPPREPDENAPSLNIKEPAEDAEGLTTSQIYQKKQGFHRGAHHVYEAEHLCRGRGNSCG